MKGRKGALIRYFKCISVCVKIVNTDREKRKTRALDMCVKGRGALTRYVSVV